MQKEFIPYEQALELKELGFDEPCICVYDDKNIHRVEQGDNTVLFKTVINSRLPDKFCSAPTFSQAFRWFREKYGLNYKIEEVSQVRFQARVYKGNGWATWEFGYKFNTYEEAELACLKKLIEIVKQPKKD